MNTQEIGLHNLPRGKKGRISRCLDPYRADAYRLLEMGLCQGAECEVVHKAARLGALEIAIRGSRLCIAHELASFFMVTIKA